MGFLGFAVTCFDVLAWPLISLGYPLYASIQAIEVKSNSDMQKLITYWILFSLISLLELGFSKPIEWLPFWPYIKLMAISYLVLPHFDGAYHVYVCLVRPYIHVNPRVVINKFNRLKELSHKGENFLAMAEKYVEENGSEALEKLIASKSKGTKPSYYLQEIMAVANTEKKEVVFRKIKKNKEEVRAIESKCKDPIVVQKDVKAVEQTEENAAAAAKSNDKDPIVVPKDNKVVEQTEKNAAAEANLQSKDKDPIVAVEQTEKNAAAAAKVKHVDANLAHAAEGITVASVKIEEITATSVAGAGGENKLPEKTMLKEVQKEWTCAVCQLTSLTEKTLNSHLQGKKHRAKCEALNASKQTDKNKGSLFSTGNISDQKSKGTKPCYNMEEIKAVANTEKKEVVAAIKSKCKDPIVVQKDVKAVEQTEKNAAAAAKVKHGESNLAHAAEEITVAAVKIEEMTATSVAGAGGENKLLEITTSNEIQKEWTCVVCQLTVNCEQTFISHVLGKKHRAKCEQLKASKETDENKGSSFSTGNKSDQTPLQQKDLPGSSVSGAAGAKVNLTDKARTRAEFECFYKQTFTTFPNEKLKKTFACYLSTVMEPVAGTLYLSNAHLAFCSHRLLPSTEPFGQHSWNYCKVMVPLVKIGTINPIVLRNNQLEKYIKFETVDGHDFWFMGFVNYEKAYRQLTKNISKFVAHGIAVQPIVA